MLAIKAPAMISPQKNTSPRIRSVDTPSVIGFCEDEETKVRACTNSCNGSVNVKITTVRIAGSDSGIAILMKAPKRLQPSMIAASSISGGSALKKPISSQEQNGMVNVGYTSTSDHIEFCSPSSAMIRDSGKNSRVGGTRSVKKIA